MALMLNRSALLNNLFLMAILYCFVQFTVLGESLMTLISLSVCSLIRIA